MNNYVQFFVILHVGDKKKFIMSSGSNIETEFLELNAKNNWPALYQVVNLAASQLYY